MTLAVVHPQHQAKLSAADASDGFTPTKIIEVGLTAPLPSTPFDGHAASILAGCPRQALSAAYITEEDHRWTRSVALGRTTRTYREAVPRTRLAEPVTLTSNRLKTAPDLWPYLRSRAELLPDAPSISVVVCTRDRPTQLRTCYRISSSKSTHALRLLS